MPSDSMVFGSMIPSYTGHLLVASPRLEDPIFGRSVCLIMHHDPSGAIGVLLNRPLRTPTQLWAPPQLWALLEAEENRSRLLSEPKSARCVHFGGPLSGPVVAVHSNRKFAEAETADGVYIAAQQGYLQKLIQCEATAAPVRLIIGHAGWRQGKLEEEIESGLWYPLPATAERVFESDESMWPQLVRKGLGHALSRWIGVDDSRGNPNWN